MIEMHDDYWTSTKRKPQTNPEENHFCLTQLKDVSPLKERDEEFEQLNVPKALQQTMFGQQNVGSGQAVSALKTYAIVDAAKITSLPEMLAASGLQYRCLYQGKAAEELRDAAPYLVELDETNRFTRSLFLQGDAPWEIWGRSAYILLRSVAGMKALSDHLRRFVKFKNVNGIWLFFRFYDPNIFQIYIEHANGAHCAGLFGEKTEPLIKQFLFLNGQIWFEVSGQWHGEVIRSVDPHAAHQISLFLAADRELSALQRRGAIDAATVPTDQHQSTARSVVASVHPFGFRGRYHLRYFIAWSLMYGAELAPLQPQIEPHLRNNRISIEDRFQAISNLIRTQLDRKMGALFD